ncbi:hypothetical protein Q4543_16630 [Salipiger sp. 1_MG-2023]|uniref:hypothetical protein n=1 Tax=Salipiger sp. 1_MG-2023 TaxID=3062665 RepID=UPI0026E33545|nr:hypothetical protein [Salipiger sp. 1_MG-2023]MDO6587135.1 hypothetical protein [Salipiger sp. 1_MG-2023]MDO6587142.1 hypothetical protein [Salipiger sp. 1_MG-2023]
MGGIGSGRHHHFSAKILTSDFRALDVRLWAREGLISPGNAFGWQWSCNGEQVASIRVKVETSQLRLIYRTRTDGGDWSEMDYSVQLDATPCHLGGERHWFLCPARDCGRRVALLYGGAVFACRSCHRLAYPSQREDASDRLARRAGKIRDRLQWEPGILNGEGGKPKGMHWRTYRKLVHQQHQLSQASVAAMLARFGRDPVTQDMLARELIEW